AVGLTKPALYYHFSSKEALFLAAVHMHMDHHRQVLLVALGQPGSLRERLAGGLQAHLDRVREHPEVMKLLLTAEHRPEQGVPEIDLLSMHQENTLLLTRLLEDGVSRGEIRSDLNLATLAISLVGLVNIWSLHCLHDQPLPDNLPDHILDIFFNGVSP
ncbi:MAG: AcrR family transcriptional regulator, partial [Myxococcota bacterium]